MISPIEAAFRLRLREWLGSNNPGLPASSTDDAYWAGQASSTEQAVGHAALAIGGAAHGGGEETWLKVYLYSRAQSVMGGTA